MQNLLVRFFLTYQLCMMSLSLSAQEAPENHAPLVKIMQPVTGETLGQNTMVPYEIQVNDVEDGHSAYEEIQEQQVIFVVKYLEDSSEVYDYLAKIAQDLRPIFAMTKSTCLTCHAASSKLIGPSFDLVAKKYKGKDHAQTYLTEKVMQGSVGIWGEEIMPPHPDLKKEELTQIVDWILTQADNPTQFYVGLEGAVRTTEATNRSGKEVYVLTAGYEDDGLAPTSKQAKVGLQSRVCKVRP